MRWVRLGWYPVHFGRVIPTYTARGRVWRHVVVVYVVPGPLTGFPVRHTHGACVSGASRRVVGGQRRAAACILQQDLQL